MRRLLILLLALNLPTRLSPAQTNTPDRPPPELLKMGSGIGPPASGPPSTATTAEMQSSIDRLMQSNRELLDLLKKQQAVLVDMQYDRRLQSRQIQSLEERLEETLFENAQLQGKIAKLEAAAANPSSPPPATPPPNATNAGPPQPTPPPSTAPPPPPSSYLPAPESEGMVGTKSWRRLFTLSGTDGKNSDMFHIEGPQWRVLWHNQDKEGKAYKNTSALFISAFPKDDTIPQKVCSKLGSGGDSTELVGKGNYYLKIEASGGTWELAVEDFR